MRFKKGNQQRKSAKTKATFWKKISKINKPVARLATEKKKRDKKRRNTLLISERRISLLFLCTLKISKDMSNSKPTI